MCKHRYCLSYPLLAVMSSGGLTADSRSEDFIIRHYRSQKLPIRLHSWFWVSTEMDSHKQTNRVAHEKTKTRLQEDTHLQTHANTYTGFSQHSKYGVEKFTPSGPNEDFTAILTTVFFHAYIRVKLNAFCLRQKAFINKPHKTRDMLDVCDIMYV